MIAGRGASEFIWAMGRELNHRTVRIPLPGYTDYLKVFPGRGFSVAGEQIASIEQTDAALAGGGVVIISNPHNPTGACLDPNDLVAIATARPDSILVVDESYIGFTPNPVARSVIGCDAPNVVVLQSTTKFYGIAATRTGIAWSAEARLLRRLFGRQENGGLSGVDVCAACAAVRDVDWADDSRRRMLDDSAWLAALLSGVEGLDLCANPNVHFQYAFCEGAIEAAAPSDARTGVLGVAVAAAGAVAYGVATVIGRALAAAGVDSATALSARFAVAAVLLAITLGLRSVPVRPLPGEWLPIVLLGAIGYSAESTLFYLSMEHGTAGACIMLFCAYPAIVVVIELVRERIRLTRKTFQALVLSTVGTLTVVAVGRDVSISTVGVVLALAAAGAYGLYLIVGRELGRRSDPMTAACWVAAGASASSAVRGAVTGSLEFPSGHLLQIAAYGVSTAVAFSLTFAALSRIEASQAAVVMALEAVSTVVLAALVLGESVSVGQACGGLAVIGAAAVTAWSRASESVTDRGETKEAGATRRAAEGISSTVSLVRRRSRSRIC
jgi:drug/metabolite transporter (DMT)-like permease